MSQCLTVQQSKCVRDSLHRAISFLDRFHCPVKVQQVKMGQPRRHDYVWRLPCQAGLEIAMHDPDLVRHLDSVGQRRNECSRLVSGLLFIQVGSRRVWVSSATAHPDSGWVAQQARNFCMDLPDDRKKAIIMHDGDTKFTEQFRAILKSEGLRPQQVVFRSPNLNAFVERMVQTLKQECLDHFVVLGERHLNRIVSEFVRYYHNLRPHQSLENRPPGVEQQPEKTVAFDPSSVVCHEALGGLLKHYERRAA